jgi:hypothetical protein
VPSENRVSLFRYVQPIADLQVHPSFGRRSQCGFELAGGPRRDRLPAVDDLVDYLERPAHDPCEVSLGPTPVRYLLPDVIAWREGLILGTTLRHVCTDAGLAELVACWHRMTPEVRAAIRRLVRGEG